MKIQYEPDDLVYDKYEMPFISYRVIKVKKNVLICQSDMDEVEGITTNIGIRNARPCENFWNDIKIIRS